MQKQNNLERRFQSNLIKELYKIFPGCLITKMDSSYIQGIPDLLILYKTKWAVLECKNSAQAKHQPNQDYYVQKLDAMGMSRFIYPENKESVIRELINYFNI